MDKWGRKFQQFMAGRYGADPFSRFLSGCIVALLVVNLFVRTHILYWLAVILLIYTYYRMFSRNISAHIFFDIPPVTSLLHFSLILLLLG